MCTILRVNQSYYRQNIVSLQLISLPLYVTLFWDEKDKPVTTILRPDHFTVLTDDLKATEDFYTQILGFTVGPRPDFKFNGIWFYANDAAILHVMQRATLPIPRNGVLDHMAFRGEDINALLQKLETAGVDYKVKRTPDPWVQWQVFFEGPSGEVVEVDYDGQETIDPVYKA